MLIPNESNAGASQRTSVVVSISRNGRPGFFFFWYWFGYQTMYLRIPTWSSRITFLLVSHTWSPLHYTYNSHSVTSRCRPPTWAFTSHSLRKWFGPQWMSTVRPGWTSSTVVSSSKSSTICTLASRDITCGWRRSTSRSFATTSGYRM